MRIAMQGDDIPDDITALRLEVHGSRDAGTATWVLVLRGRDACDVLIVHAGAAPGDWALGRSRPGIAAFDLPASLLFPGMAWSPATADAMLAMGGLAPPVGAAGQAPDLATLISVRATRRERSCGPPPERNRPTRRDPFDPPGSWDAFADSAPADPGHRCAGGGGIPSLRRVVPLTIPPGTSTLEKARVAIAAVAGAALAPWTASLRQAIDAEGGAPLGAIAWSPDNAAMLSTPSRIGLHRRQACAAWPALVPLILSDRAVLSAVDAGASPLGALSDAVSAWSGIPVPPAAIRRMRHLPGGLAGARLKQAIVVSSLAGPDRLPRDGAGWLALIPHVETMLVGAEILGLRAADLLRPLPGPEVAVGDPWLTEAKDMAERLRDGLLRPAAFPDALPACRGRDVAAGLLFGGLSLAGVVAKARAWHGALGEFDRAIGPCEAGAGLAWEVPCPPYDAGGGIEACFLGSTAELAEEGGTGPDRDGVPGLAHCVRGYATGCAAGNRLVASIRRREADGTVRRLSTVELAHDAGTGHRVVQHRGLRNAEPPPEAIAALADFLDALRTGRTGGPVPAAAMAVAGRRDQVTVAFSAWSPWLARGVVRGGVPALVARLAPGNA